MCAEIINARLGYAVVDYVVGNKIDFLAQSKLLSMLIDDNAHDAIRERLADKVNEIIDEKAPDASAAIVSHYKTKLMESRVCDMYAKYQDKEDKITDGIVEMYASTLETNLGKLLQAINIEQIVVDKINSLDPAELEETIFGVMHRELRAIVYLGALLGFVMGFVNLLF